MPNLPLAVLICLQLFLSIYHRQAFYYPSQMTLKIEQTVQKTQTQHHNNTHGRKNKATKRSKRHSTTSHSKQTL